jgi:hypothetical protein
MCSSYFLTIPWEKGSIENRNGVLRRYFPKKHNWALTTQKKSLTTGIVSSGVFYSLSLFVSRTCQLNPGYKNQNPKASFGKVIVAEFEHFSFCITEAYDSILKNLYGDYMILPHEEKRKSNHDICYYKF